MKIVYFKIAQFWNWSILKLSIVLYCLKNILIFRWVVSSTMNLISLRRSVAVTELNFVFSSNQCPAELVLLVYSRKLQFQMMKNYTMKSILIPIYTVWLSFSIHLVVMVQWLGRVSDIVVGSCELESRHCHLTEHIPDQHMPGPLIPP